MTAAAVPSLLMPRKTESPKKGISLSITRENIAALEEIADEIAVQSRVTPSLSHLVNLAIADFVAAWRKAEKPKKSAK